MLVGRLAPSPTGLLHVGNARSLLLAWLAARHVGGAIHLRIDVVVQRIDHVFASAGPKASQPAVFGGLASDHLGIAVTLSSTGAR